MIEILKYTIPVLIVVFGIIVVLYIQNKHEAQRRQWELKRLSQKEISPLRMRAYERLTLVLERTEPEFMIMEMMRDNEDLRTGRMTVLALQQALLQRVRLEFDHNMSQQIYVSDELWQHLLLARDEMGAYINSMAIQLQDKNDTMAYAKVLMTAYHNNGDTPHEIALDLLKKEAKTLL